MSVSNGHISAAWREDLSVRSLIFLIVKRADACFLPHPATRGLIAPGPRGCKSLNFMKMVRPRA
jgi:hypothetical protein